MEQKIENPANDFLNLVRDRYTNYMTKMGYEKQIEPVTMTKGSRYYKILIGGSVHSFVDAKTNDIFKPAGGSAPAKHARGNVLSESGGEEALDEVGYHVRYL